MRLIGGWALAISLSTAVVAADNYALDRGPLVGDPIPHTLETQDQFGSARDFQSIKGENGLILLFSRSLDWCVFCKGEALDWNARYKDFVDHGYQVAIITYDSVEDLRRFSGRRDIGLTLLSDPESEVIRAFDILNEHSRPGSRTYGIPHPAIFVVDPSGVITHRFAEQRYSSRTDIDLVLATIATANNT